MMKIKLIELLVVVFMVVSLNKSIHAQNPIIQNVYTADPAPMVHNDTLFLFTGHDEDETTEKGFIIKYYKCFSNNYM
jgi:arabinoxylan arabinofuranohydrolase